MKKYAVSVLVLLHLLAGCSILRTGSGEVPALTDSELVYLDNLTSGGGGSNAENLDDGILAPGYEAPWYLSRLPLFPSLYYDSYSAYNYPYAGPYAAVYGYQWLYYDDHHELNRYEHRGRYGSALTGAFENMQERLQDCRVNIQSFMHDRRDERRERFENIRDRLQDLLSHERSFGLRDNRRDDFDSRLTGREQRGIDSRGRR